MAFLSGSRTKVRSKFDPFTDLLFNTLLGFTFLFIAAMMFMNPMTKKGIIDPKAEYLIVVTWPDYSPDDIDTWVEDPSGNLVWFRNPQAGLIHLDRDDRGALNDTLVVNGQKIQNPLNQEVVTIRAVVPGEYVVNLHYYASETNKPVEVSVTVSKVNPSLEVVYHGTVTLQKRGDEQTAVRFNIADDGKITEVNHLEKKLVRIQGLSGL